MSQVFDPHCLGSINGRNVYSEEYVNGLAEQATKYMNEVKQLRAQIAQLTAEPYVIRISRREFMALPIETRRQVMLRQAEQCCEQTEKGEN
jgi:hypothetical protein